MLIGYLPAGSNLSRALHGPGAEWTVDSYLLANVIDILAVANWQRTDTKKTKPPKPFARPKDMKKRLELELRKKDLARRERRRKKRQRKE